MTVRVEAEYAGWEEESYNLRIRLWAAKGISVSSINVSLYRFEIGDECI
jgi:hypothetical protein